MSSLDDSLERHDELRTRVALMITLRVQRWGDIELHPSAFTPRHDDTTQQSLSPDEQREHERRERARVLSASSGGPVRRLSGTTG